MLTKVAAMFTNGDLDKLMRLGDCSIVKEMSDRDPSKIEARLGWATLRRRAK
jgi:hypothetical protein